MISRVWTNRFRWLIDELLPPVVRDSPLFALFFGVVAGKQATVLLRFKQVAATMTEADFVQTNDRIETIERDTDLTPDALAAILGAVRGRRLVDIGCGRGYLARKLALSKCSVVGVDLRPVHIEGIQSCCANVERLPFRDRSFDTVICTHTLEHVRDIPAAIVELRRIAVERIIIVVPKQRPYRATFDLHLSFFPYESSLRAAIGHRMEAQCREIDGDWFYVEPLKPGS